MQEQIEQALALIEQEKQVRILYAVESGSRAWGFASPDSDYDARFIYAGALTDYLRVEARRDVIELPIVNDLDVNGWDLFKALTLFRKSNPPLLEWLYSPIIYREDGDFAAQLRELARDGYSPRRMTYHYLSMARQSYKGYIEGREQVALKKYLYALRPLICCRWIEQNHTPPPTSFVDALVGTEIALEVGTAINELIIRKRAAGEMGLAPPIAVLNAFIEREIQRVDTIVASLPDPEMDVNRLNQLAWTTLGVTPAKTE